MSKKENKNRPTAPDGMESEEACGTFQEKDCDNQAPQEKQEAGAPQEETPAGEETDPLLAELEALKDQGARQEEKYLRLAAEYDNYRKRTAKEKESLWADVKADQRDSFSLAVRLR